MLGNGVEMGFIFRRILGPLVLGWAPNHFVLGAQLAPVEKRLVYIPESSENLHKNEMKIGFHLGDNCIQKFHLVRYIVKYSRKFSVTATRSGAVKRDFRTYISRKFMTLSNQTSHCICKCIRITFLCKFSCICNFAIIVWNLMKFSPK